MFEESGAVTGFRYEARKRNRPPGFRGALQKGVSMAVFVLDRTGRPLMPCSEKRARKLLNSRRARVHKLFPFVIRLVDRTVAQSAFQPLRLSLDPGSKTTGLALSRIEKAADGVVEPVMHVRFLMELVHRGHAIKESLHAPRHAPPAPRQSALSRAPLQ